MKKIIFFFVFCYSLFNVHYSFSQNGWFNLASGTSVKLNSIFFLDSSIGYIVGDNGIILRTTNSGVNWIWQNSNTNQDFITIHFPSFDTGYITGGNKLLKTTDGGQNWFLISSYSGLSGNAMYFSTNNDGFITSGLIGIAGLIKKTTDGGYNWIIQAVANEPVYSVHFSDVNTGYLGGGSYSYGTFILKTTDCGNNWILNQIGTVGFIRSIFFISQNSETGFAVGEMGLIIKTCNYGTSWISQNSGTGNALYSVTFNNLNTGYIVGALGKILKTTNSGNNWVNQNSGTSNHLYSVFFVNSNTGYTVGENGIILKTTTGGSTDINQVSELIPIDFSLSQNYPNPFNPNTNIKFKVESYKVIKLIVYDILGKEIATLVNEKLKPGEYEVQFPNNQYNNNQLPSGVYFYSLFADGSLIDTKKLVLLK